MTAGERVGSHRSTDMMRSPRTDQSHLTEGNTDETGTESLTEIKGIGVRLVVETDAHLTLAAEVTEIGLATGPLLLESPVGAAIGRMAPNRPHLLLVLNFQILSLLISWEAIVVH